MVAKINTPSRLGSEGRRLWRAVVDGYELRPDELLVLEKACRTADDSARLDAAVVDGPLMVPGSMGQQRQNPLLHEARQSRALLATLLKQLSLPNDETVGQPSATTVRAMIAARARWGTRGA